MKPVLRKLIKVFAYGMAAVVILLAVAVGVFRLMLPQLPEYQAEIEARVGEVIGHEVRFERMDARWRLSGPELVFEGVTVSDPESGAVELTLEQVNVGAGLLHLLRERRLAVGRVLLEGAEIDLGIDERGRPTLQGVVLDPAAGGAGPELPEDIRLRLVDVALRFDDARTPEPPVLFTVEEAELVRRDGEDRVEAEIGLPPALGASLTLSGSHRAAGAGRATRWEAYLESERLSIGGLRELVPQIPALPEAGEADFSVWLVIDEGMLRRATGEVALTGIELPAKGGFDAARFDTIAGRAEWALDEGRWLAVVDRLEVERAGRSWPSGALKLEADLGPGGAAETLRLEAQYLHLGDLMTAARWLPPRWRETLGTLAPRGELRDLSASLSPARLFGNASEAAIREFSLETALEDAGIEPFGPLPGVEGFDGRLRADNTGGRIELASDAIGFSLPRLSARRPVFSRGEATVIWRRGSRGLSVIGDGLALANDEIETTAGFELLVRPGGSPVLDLTAEWSMPDAGVVERYLPEKLMKPGLVSWLGEAIESGRVESGSLRLSGPLARFPYDEGEGVFRVESRMVDGVLRYGKSWPEVAVIEAMVTVSEGLTLSSTENTARTGGARVTDTRVVIGDLRRPLLEIEGSASAGLEQLRRYALASPIARVLGPRLIDVEVAGRGRVAIDLEVPVLDKSAYRFTAVVSTDDGELGLAGLPPRFTGLAGEATVTRQGVSAERIGGRFLGRPVDISLRLPPEDQRAYSTIAEVRGALPSEALVNDLGLPLAGRLEGETAFRARARFPKRIDGEAARPFVVELDSDLDGLAIGLPAPVAKAPEAAVAFGLTAGFPEEGVVDLAGSYGDTVEWSLILNRRDPGWGLARGVIQLGAGRPILPVGEGLHIEGEIERLRVGDWLALATAPDGDADAGGGLGVGAMLESVDLVIDDAYGFGQRVRDVAVVLERGPEAWRITLDSETVAGDVTLPRPLEGDRPVRLDMTRLMLVEADPGPGAQAGAIGSADGDNDGNNDGNNDAGAEPRSDAGAGADTGDPPDPRDVPPLSIRAEQFALGERDFGAVEIEVRKTDGGLEASSLIAEAPSFLVTGSGSWLVEPGDPRGQRTALQAVLTSTGVQDTLSRLGSDPGIDAESATARFDVSWSGAPRPDFLSELDGQVSIEIADGQLEEVEPGAGKVFGLLSVAALPRRLALDFRDVFDKGLAFDEITGDFRIVNGEAYTCNLSLESSVADVGIVGRAGLAQRDYNQTAIVGANVGGSLPAVGAVIGGPQAAAAMLLFSQIFKKPLQGLGQAYYQVTGSWEDPTVERTEAERFVATSQLADCELPEE